LRLEKEVAKSGAVAEEKSSMEVYNSLESSFGRVPFPFVLS
jgi:hypothetical protein